MIRPTILGTIQSDTDVGYMKWYYHVSHPRLVPPLRDAPREVLVLVYEVGPSDPSWARVSTLINRYLRQIDVDEDDP